MSKPLILELKEKIDNMNTYSTEEVKTGETWIDGKAIYRKVIQTGAIQSTTKTKSHGISNLDVVVDISGILFQGTTYYKLPRISIENVNQQISMSCSKTYISLEAGSDANFSDSFIILKYTKTNCGSFSIYEE